MIQGAGNRWEREREKYEREGVEDDLDNIGEIMQNNEDVNANEVVTVVEEILKIDDTDMLEYRHMQIEDKHRADTDRPSATLTDRQTNVSQCTRQVQHSM